MTVSPSFATNPWLTDPFLFPQNNSLEDKLLFMLDYAVLAPSIYNTQPWRFQVTRNCVSLFVDKRRWLKVSDPDERELHLSVGCALENLLITIEHFDYAHKLEFFPEPDKHDLVARVHVTEALGTTGRDSALFEAIRWRHTSRRVFNDRLIAQRNLQRLRSCCEEEDVSLFMTQDDEVRASIAELLRRADVQQVADPSWRNERRYWEGEGALDAFQQPKAARSAVTHLRKDTTREDLELLMSAPVLAVLATQSNRHLAQLKAGQVLERLWLAATALGLQLQPMQQVLQLPELKRELAALTLPDSNPQVLLRLGYGIPERAHTPRRPLSSMLL